MLIADILAKQEKLGDAIIYAQNALDIAVAEKDYNFQSRIYGFLSTQYRTIGFHDKGKSFLIKGLAVSDQIENKEQVLKYRAMSHPTFMETAQLTCWWNI
ncbi:hypothetical protein [Nonlabens antarcticus]|uniref:hypothetical protein n=1 Tax=Nonlabens antarcticus TaxID=392714 RepID=UPI001891A6BF|nr:hypothetical protein [Nonlabens antarcticus]